MKIIIGVYKITNTQNNNCYIGSSVNIQKRLYEHKRILNKNKHHSILLQRAWNKYGESSFTFSILEETNIENLLKLEQYYLDTNKPEYNILKFVGVLTGYKHTEETIQKLKIVNLGKKYRPKTAEEKEVLRQVNLGRKRSDETKLKQSLLKLGKPLSAERKEKLIQSCNSDKRRENQKLGVIQRKINNKPTKPLSPEDKLKHLLSVCVEVLAVDVEYKVIHEFSSHKEACIFLNRSECTLWRAIKSKKLYKEFIWIDKKDYLRLFPLTILDLSGKIIL